MREPSSNPETRSPETRNPQSSAGGTRRIGIIGGTFDPPHLGHLFIAEEARVACGLEQVLWMPNNVPAHREGKTASAEPAVRLHMTEAAIASNSCFVVSRVELDRPGPSYLYDTLHALQELYPGAELYFICGADSLRDIQTWYRSTELFRLCTFVAATRPGVDGAAALEALPPELRERVVWLEVPGLHIASRDLRARVAQGLPVRYLVPDEVERLIRSQSLYRAK